MIVETPNSDSIQAGAPPKPQRAEVRRFFMVSVGFLAGFIAAALALNGVIAAYLHKTSQRGGLGGEVQMAWERVEKNNDAVRVVVLGDSVARQLFYPYT